MTCLCLTRNRRQWLPQAIRCYQAQTYPNRELLIIADGEPVHDLIPDDPSIRYVHIAGHSQIGAKRNLGCERARGEVIAHWDDDDYSAPGRLRDQVERLEGFGVTGYRTLRFTDGTRWWLYSGASNYAPGSTLCYRKSFWESNKFPDIQIGEDQSFVTKARNTLVLSDAGDLMHATIHPGNTSPRQLDTKQWKEL